VPDERPRLLPLTDRPEKETPAGHIPHGQPNRVQRRETVDLRVRTVPLNIVRASRLQQVDAVRWLR